MTTYQFLSGPFIGCLVDDQDKEWKESFLIESFYSAPSDLQEIFIKWIKTNTNLNSPFLSEDEMEFYWRSWISSWEKTVYLPSKKHQFFVCESTQSINLISEAALFPISVVDKHFQKFDLYDYYDLLNDGSCWLIVYELDDLSLVKDYSLRQEYNLLFAFESTYADYPKKIEKFAKQYSKSKFVTCQKA